MFPLLLIMFPFAGHSTMDIERSVSRVGQQFLIMLIEKCYPAHGTGTATPLIYNKIISI